MKKHTRVYRYSRYKLVETEQIKKSLSHFPQEQVRSSRTEEVQNSQGPRNNCWTGSLLLGSTPVPFFFPHKRTKATFSHESVAPSSDVEPIKPLRDLSEATISAPFGRWLIHAYSFYLFSTCNTQAYSIHEKENQPSISLSCDSRGSAH